MSVETVPARKFKICDHCGHREELVYQGGQGYIPDYNSKFQVQGQVNVYGDQRETLLYDVCDSCYMKVVEYLEGGK